MTITAAGARLDDPSFVIDYDAAVGAAAVQLKCAGRRITHQADQEFEDVETFCNPRGRAVGATEHTIVVEILSSYGAGGSFNQLLPLEGELVKFAFLPAGATAVSADNPEMSGELYVPAISFVDAGVRKFSYPSLEFPINGTPLFTFAPPAVYAGHA